MTSVNRVILLGNLGDSPVLRYNQNREAIARFSVATSSSWRDPNRGEMRETTDWHRVVLYKDAAESAARSLEKGSKVYIEGRLQTREWTDRGGVTRRVTEILAEDMQILYSPGMSGRGGASNPAPPSDADIPRAMDPSIEEWIRDYDRAWAEEKAREEATKGRVMTRQKL